VRPQKSLIRTSNVQSDKQCLVNVRGCSVLCKALLRANVQGSFAGAQGAKESFAGAKEPCTFGQATEPHT